MLRSVFASLCIATYCVTMSAKTNELEHGTILLCDRGRQSSRIKTRHICN